MKIGILGYGNLGKGVEQAIRYNKDMELAGVFTRRDPSTIATVTKNIPVYHIDSAKNMTNQIDVMILCVGSMSDMPDLGPVFAGMFNTVDGYDNHAQIPGYFDTMNKSALEAGKVSIISSGWDPGMFSINRLYADAILPEGNTYTFWGKGISQGHSNAIRKIKGVKDATQYTIPMENAIEAVRRGDMPVLKAGEKHWRECFVVAEEGADKAWIENKIKTMPDYFSEYKTEVHFITEEELKENHSKLPHGGLVIRYGKTGFDGENNQRIEYRLSLDSNPEFTANILVAFARAAYRLNREGVSGAKTVIDIAPAYLSNKSGEELRRELI
jgi:diaminopimelate dehydrogenase